MNQPTHSWRRTGFFLLGLALAVVLLAGLTSLLYAQEEEPTPGAPDLGFQFLRPAAAELAGDKTVNRLQASPGDVLQYTLTIENTGDEAFTTVYVTDTLPAGLTYVADSYEGPAGENVAGNVLTWSGALFARTEVTLSFEAEIADDVELETVLENVMEVSAGAQNLLRSAQTTVVAEPQGGTYYLPFVRYYDPILPPAASATTPNSAGQWTINWTVADEDLDTITGFYLDESQSPTFDDYSRVNLGPTARSMNVTKAASPNNVYYYRVVASGAVSTSPSNVVMVIGNYFDDFSDPGSGWQVRRMTYLEKTYAYYLSGNLVTLVDDRWDWVLASPLRPAPAVPYVIEYRARVNDASNLVSGGVAFGGDWNGGPCPEPGNVYQTGNCFNRFYNHNYIFYGPLKLYWEKVNQLFWCPSCGGSPLKRLADTRTIDPVLANGPSLDWHTYRIEVRADSVQTFIDGQLIDNHGDTQYINQPYFGTFASTDEYKPSIWLYDYFAATRLD